MAHGTLGSLILTGSALSPPRAFALRPCERAGGDTWQGAAQRVRADGFSC